MSTPAVAAVAAPGALLHLSVVLGDRILNLPPLAPTIDVGTIKMIIQSETNVNASSLVLLYKQIVLTDGQTLAGVGVKTDEMLEARAGAVARPAQPSQPQAAARPAQPQQSGAASGVASQRSTNSLGIPDAILHDAGQVRQFIRNTPQLLFSIEAQNPPLYQAILLNDLSPFAAMWKNILANIEHEQAEERERFRLANADPMDPEVQARIAEEIRLKNVDENYQLAVEHAPEVFGRVIMLYVPMTVNGTKVQAFVDSGAQSTIMSIQCAERCGIMRLVDKRFAGMAKGVGSAKIIGRVHQVPVVLGSNHMSMSFTILDNPDMDFLLGLDQLKNHQACIDLQKNVLRIQGEEIAFLAEKDLPGHAKESGGDEEMPQASSSSGAAASSSSGAAKPSAAAAAPSRPTPAPAAAAAASNNSTPARPAATAASQPSQSSAQQAAVAAAQQRAAAQAAASTPARPAAAPVASPPAAAGPTDAYVPTADHISQLTDLGFARQDCINALTRFGGNVDAAASFLFSQ